MFSFALIVGKGQGQNKPTKSLAVSS